MGKGRIKRNYVGCRLENTENSNDWKQSQSLVDKRKKKTKGGLLRKYEERLNNLQIFLSHVILVKFFNISPNIYPSKIICIYHSTNVLYM